MIAIYARQSVERENSISCETQIEYGRSAIKPDERGEKVQTFVDNGFSGGNTNRDGFQKMMKMVRQGKIGKVIVYKLDRISRSLADFVNILQEFKEHNVEFVSSQESFDTSSPYGEMIVKILMVFAEFERTSIINRVTQAYAHRSEMGFYMGGRQPYGFELVPAVIHGIDTRKLQPIPSEIEQIRYIYEVYAGECVSLRRLLDILVNGNKEPLNGSRWTTAKLSALLKNPIYVKADSDVYDYFESRGVRMVTEPAQFTGTYGAQLYGRTKHNPDNPDWSDMKLVLMSHIGVINSDIWLKCQCKLEKNRQITNSYSNPTSWLAGKVVCKKCGHTMTIVKGKVNKNGEMRRYFNCTGKSHKRVCTGIKVTVYAEDLEDMLYDCIYEKLSDLKGVMCSSENTQTAEINELKLRIKEIERAEAQLMDAILAGGFNGDMIAIANQKAVRFKNDKLALCGRIDALKAKDTDIVINPGRLWKKADYGCKKEVAAILIDKIIISEDGSVKVIWKI